MDRISSHLRLPEPQSSAGVNSVFQDAVDRALDTIAEDKKHFGYWCGRLKTFQPQYISFLAAKAKDGRKPIALFSHLVKEARAQQKLATDTTDV